MHRLFTLAAFLFASQMCAQITITQSNFPRTPNYLDVGAAVNTDGMVVPEHGKGITWNYSANGFDVLSSTTWNSAAGDPDFPDALNWRAQTLLFNNFQIYGRLYESVDANGWYEPGRIVDDVTYSITEFTGGANDILRFPNQIQHYAGRINSLEFPVMYQNTWTGSRQEKLAFELTVMAYGLNKTPGENRAMHTQYRDVVGEGKLIIPDINGKPSNPINVVMIRTTQVIVDSFFLGGSPAPDPLLAAFNLTQGASVTLVSYAFYTPNFAAPVLFVRLDENGNLSSAYCRPAAAELTSSVFEVVSGAHTYPNPVAAGEALTIDIGNSNGTSIDVVDFTGRVVATISDANTNSKQIQLRLPLGTAPGLYTVTVRSPNAKLLSASQVIVR